MTEYTLRDKYTDNVAETTSREWRGYLRYVGCSSDSSDAEAKFSILLTRYAHMNTYYGQDEGNWGTKRVTLRPSFEKHV